ncbi:MAG: glutaminase A [Eubacterium sp.]|nr:glutaminase A [Eubacterium sp.]
MANTFQLKTHEEAIRIIEEAMEAARTEIPNGRVADYIPELGKADPNKLGICIYPLHGEKISVGDYTDRFTMQSISKIFSLCIALELFGKDKLFEKIGSEPSGEAFNSLVELDLNSNKPYNPLINSGAIAVAGMLIDEVSFHDMVIFARELCDDDDITINRAVYDSEMATCSRNKAIAYLLESKGIIETDVEDALNFYTKMCALETSAESLANFANRLANDGVGNKSGKRYLSSETVRIVKTLMLTCGMYDGSGTYAVEVGIPTKSGVGGGLMAVSNKRAGIGVFGPALDEKGNSIAGCRLLKEISQKLRLSIFYDTDNMSAKPKEYSLNEFSRARHKDKKSYK